MRARHALLGAAVAAIPAQAAAFTLAPRRAAFAYLVAFAACVSTAAGALLLLCIMQTLQARWFLPLRRACEVGVATLPALAVAFLPVLLWRHELYVWTQPQLLAGPEAQELVAAKAGWLNAPFFAARAALFLGSWALLGEALWRASQRQNLAPERYGQRMQRLGAAGLPLLALTTTFAAFDWLMSLEPTWYSTIYGVYFASGGFAAALAALTLAAWRGHRQGPLADMHASHFSALGRLLLAFVCFWAYIAYSQVLVIWMGDMPREVPWYLVRLHGSWGACAALGGVMAFALPFLLLVPWGLKRRPAALAAVGAVVLVGHYLDTYWLVMPHASPAGVAPHWADATALVSVAAPSLAFALHRARLNPWWVADPGLDAAWRYRSA
jgi:hypothetical protein